MSRPTLARPDVRARRNESSSNTWSTIVKRPRVHEASTSSRAALPAVEVEDDRRDVLDLRVDRVAEDDRLHDRHDEHEKQRRRLPADVRELLEQDGHEPVERPGGFARRAAEQRRIRCGIFPAVSAGPAPDPQRQAPAVGGELSVDASFPLSAARLSVTNTSSSVGAIGRNVGRLP